MNTYENFKTKVLEMTKIDLNAYKERQMKRRIDALISKRGVHTYDEYVEQLRTNPEAMDEFVTYLTINVSEFYRNPEQWKLLETEILPYLFELFGKEIRIWSAACSTGDEPYTLVMLLAKFIPMRQIHIIATDIDKQVLDRAKLGIYDKKSVKGLPKEYLTKYFKQLNEYSYQISDEVKACVQFKQHNLLRDSYPNDLDMVICRNVLIYFTDEAKNDIYLKFHKSLKKDGILFVGSTEQIIAPQTVGFSSHRSFFYKRL